MRFTGVITDANIDFISGKPKVTFSLNEKSDFLQSFDDLKAVEKLSIEVKPYRQRRSLDANAYMWVLLDKLAEKLLVPKEDLYRNAIKDIGGNSEIVCVRNEAVKRLRSGWQNNGIGWQTETFPSKIDGCTNVILYYGSSTYDKAQMSRLVDIVVQDCQAVGIPTETPEKLAELKSLWGD